jgi:hypothetical protein
VKKIFLKYFFFLVALCACSNSEGLVSSEWDGVELSTDSLSGMVRVAATNASIHLGSD